MYRSSPVFVFLLAFLGIVAVCNAAPIDTTVRHNGVNHGNEGASASSANEKPAESPMEGHGAHDESHGMENPESDKPSEDHSSHGHGSHDEGMSETEHSSEDHSSHDEEDHGSHDEEDHGSHDEEDHGSHDEEDHSSHGHEGHDADKPEGEKPSHGGSHGHGHDQDSHGGEKPEAATGAAGSEETDEPESSPSAESGVCIGAYMLGNFEAHELVFEKHILARVLCDSAGSCATKGHIVNFKGKGMMMGSYCEVVGCTESVMEVNSPKYSRGLKVQSRSDDMHFTAFAAKYETRSEEAVLSAAVRMGL